MGVAGPLMRSLPGLLLFTLTSDFRFDMLTTKTRSSACQFTLGQSWQCDDLTPNGFLIVNARNPW
jgi:hypothetical protein